MSRLEKLNGLLLDLQVSKKVPLHMQLWTVKEDSKYLDDNGELVFSTFHQSQHYHCSVFYKPLTQCIDLTDLTQ